jgi:FkbM family methyltransferase
MSVSRAWFTTEGLRFLVRALKARFRDQTAEMDVIRQHLRPGDIACDIGANKGSFILWLSRWVGRGRVVAFEPQPALARYLQSICGPMAFDNVTVEAKAVYAHSGEQNLYVPVGHQPGASLVRTNMEAESLTTVPVSVVALDDYFNAGDKVALLKIDVEGAELGVLKGGERLLRNQSPLLIFECENRHLAPGKVEDVFSYLIDLGYEGSFVCRDRILPLSQFDAAVHQRQDGDWFWKSKDYCNNFVFRKRPS